MSSSLISFLQARAEDPSRDDSPYGYTPTKAVCIIFIVLFAVSTFAHTAQAVKYRMWWLFPTMIIGGLTEVLGWSGRLWSSFNILSDDAFMIQICATIMGPTPILAASFIIFGLLVDRLGHVYSRLPPKRYALIFVTCDVIALAVQGGGGGVASSADTNEGAKLGSNIMLGGIVFQTVVLVLYMILAAEVLIRYHLDRPISSRQLEGSIPRGELSPRLKWLTGALIFNSLTLFIRAIYRTIELADGWNGRIIETQIYFNILDGMMIVLAMYTFNFMHPGMLLQKTTLPSEKIAMDSRSSSNLV